MKQSEQTNELFTALALAQAEFAPATKDATNPFFKSSYATLGAILEVLNPVLGKHGLSFVQMTDVDDDGKVYLDTQINHKSGQWMRGRRPILCKDPTDPQKMGSTESYAKRYALQSAFGISTEDDDANHAAAILNTKTTPNSSKQFDAPEKPTSKATVENKTKATPKKNGCISEAQQKRLFAIATSNGWGTAQTKALLAEQGFESSSNIPYGKPYENIIACLEMGPMKEPEDQLPF
jgi:hypothetical protein